MPRRAVALLLVSLTLAAALVRAAGVEELRGRRPTRCAAAPGPRAARPASFRATARKRRAARRSAATRRSPVRWGSSPGAAHKRLPCPQRQAPRRQAWREQRTRPSDSRSASLLPTGTGTLFKVGVADRDREERIYLSLCGTLRVSSTYARDTIGVVLRRSAAANSQSADAACARVVGRALAAAQRLQVQGLSIAAPRHRPGQHSKDHLFGAPPTNHSIQRRAGSPQTLGLGAPPAAPPAGLSSVRRKRTGGSRILRFSTLRTRTMRECTAQETQ